jgi:ribosome biogenesis GTPase
LSDGSRLTCITKGRKLELACGDLVVIEVEGADRGVITNITPRSSLLYRADHYKQKTLAANVTQVVIVVAAEPPFSDELLTRCLVAAECAGLKTLIVCNKADLAQSERAWALIAPYRELGYRCIELSARTDCSALRVQLQHETSVLVGQSGMGKSTIINALAPGSQAATREISTALNSGKHTTTAAVWYALDATSAVVDTPGLQAFGLAHLAAAELAQAFPEFRAHVGHCRFRDCAHDSEPGCRLRLAVEQGMATQKRLQLLRSLVAENAAHKPWQ